jgi:transcription initiation factor IIE alpha subunit
MSHDLNSIIDQLAEIDSASAQIMKKTQDEKTKYAEYINGQKQDFDAALESKVDEEISELTEALKSESEKALLECKTQCDDEIAKLDALFTKKSESIANDIFNNIIKE